MENIYGAEIGMRMCRGEQSVISRAGTRGGERRGGERRGEKADAGGRRAGSGSATTWKGAVGYLIPS